MRLDDEGITTSNALLETNEDLTIGEVIGRGGSDRYSEFLGDLVCEFRVTASSEETEPLLGT
jgi:16S rRNA C1402 N4-methylase RsmH